jgi:hypothetical protein
MKQYLHGWLAGNLMAMAAFFVVNQFVLNYTGKVWQVGYIQVPTTYDPAVMKAAEQLAENGITDPQKLIQSLKRKQ